MRWVQLQVVSFGSAKNSRHSILSTSFKLPASFSGPWTNIITMQQQFSSYQSLASRPLSSKLDLYVFHRPCHYFPLTNSSTRLWNDFGRFLALNATSACYGMASVNTPKQSQWGLLTIERALCCLRRSCTGRCVWSLWSFAYAAPLR